ncbi:hypothetical protein QQS21_005417 [Conoideocrella luteorostrata]|uniref:Endonuclease/exonuclease/phosphatase domain-containing protein n=1 Tax=Conoideocrella luteorostrata TaxID=1105319 RepID=A0AAJ0CS14_9HYPO|nr:hypothetical protein QQS21_005417 [Conoideocrella luteorostrata]
MQLRSVVPALAALASSLAPSTATAVPRAAGSLALAADKPLLTFDYSTPDPDPKNWIGIWSAYYGGPDNQASVSYSLAWDWATEAKGTVQVNVSKLQPGAYKAYYLAKNGYKWLADPIEVNIPGTGPLAFLIDTFTTQNARRGDAFQAAVGGLLANPKKNMKWAVVDRDNADWVQVSDNGTLYGTPTSSGIAKFTVRATDADNTTGSLAVTIPVVASAAPLVSKLNVMSFNLWQGGRNINDSHRKQIKFLTSSGADIVGFQESFFNDGLRLAKALGWQAYQTSDTSIISRYPIVEVYPQTSASGSVRIAVDGEDSQVIMWNAHLGYDPYGPYDFCFSKMSREEVLKREADSKRTPQIVEIMDRMKSQIANAKEIPVLLTGDFNAPSHLDWTNATAKSHCGVGYFEWPTSIHPTEAGLVDSFREKHPDPVAVPGITWSPIYLTNNGRPEPLDRLDFVYHKGMKTLDSKILLVGSPLPETDPKYKDNEWTSDHASVMTTFQIPNKRCKREASQA